MHGCIESCASWLVSVIYIDSSLQQIQSGFDGPIESLCFGQQFFTRMGIIGYVLSFDQKIDGGEISDMDVDWVCVGVLNEGIDFCLGE